MDYIALILVAISLSMDAFAVAICNGIAIKNVKIRHASVFGLVFGGSQLVMPIVGFFLGSSFSAYIENIDHWIAFALLAFIGGKMLIDSFRVRQKGLIAGEQALSFGKLCVLGVATSIDALAVGIGIALTGWNIWISSLTIGGVTFVIAFAGVMTGKRLGVRFQNIATRLGGVVLIGIAIKILVEHLVS